MGHVYADGAEIYKACCTILQYAMSQVAVHRDSGQKGARAAAARR